MFNVWLSTSFCSCRTDKIEILGHSRVVEATDEVKTKKESQPDGVQEDESIFSAHALPISFYSDLVKGHSCKGVFLYSK